jgi:hypothetical protein
MKKGEVEVIFCGTISFRFTGSRLFTGTLLCAVRTFLPFVNKGSIAWLVATAKVKRYSGMPVFI